LLRRIRELMATPFARPPGRRKFLARYDPEVRAAVVYAVAVAVAWALWREQFALEVAAAVAYLLAGLVLWASPAAQAANALAGETEADTAEALVLTTVDRSELAWGRFAHLAWPWLRLLLWLLPLYAVMACALARLSPGDEAVYEATLAAMGPKPIAIAMLRDDWSEGGRFQPAFGALLIAFRLAKDTLDVLTLVAIGYWVSGAFRSARRAMVIAGTLGPVLMCTVFLADLWLAVLVRSGLEWSALAGATYILAGQAMLAFQCLVIWWCVSRVARNFDRYLAREGPGQ
jgi:hypothetical protein